MSIHRTFSAKYDIAILKLVNSQFSRHPLVKKLKVGNANTAIANISHINDRRSRIDVI